jgi:hypothetical protein
MTFIFLAKPEVVQISGLNETILTGPGVTDPGLISPVESIVVALTINELAVIGCVEVV